jgi:hypothetical protein
VFRHQLSGGSRRAPRLFFFTDKGYGFFTMDRCMVWYSDAGEHRIKLRKAPNLSAPIRRTRP